MDTRGTKERSALTQAAVNVFAFAAVLAAVIGVYEAIHSPLFTVQVVEVTDNLTASPSSDRISTSQAHPNLANAEFSAPIWSTPWAPVDPQTITDLAAVPVGQANLFDLDLRAVEKRILSNDWIREVKLQKRFPQTLSITAVFRDPKAVIELETGALAYVDETGKVFGQVSLAGPKDLPLITGVDSGNALELQQLVHLLTLWHSKTVSKFARVDSMTGDPERGYRLWVSYPIDHRPVRVRLDLGTGMDDPKNASFSDLARVFGYLQKHSIAARQIWADAGKKIVVKTAHGS